MVGSFFVSLGMITLEKDKLDLITPSYEEVQILRSLGSREIDKIRIAQEIEELKNPYEIVTGLMGEPLFQLKDMSYFNVKSVLGAREHFNKYGAYTNLHPTYDADEYAEFWDAEEKKCIEGATMPGRLLRASNGEYVLQNIHITGEHYTYLNYAQIKLTVESDTMENNVVQSSGGEQLAIKTKSSTKITFFPDFWAGDYAYFKAKEKGRELGLHMVVGKGRRKGYSYKNGLIAAHRANFMPKSCTVLGAFDSSSLYPEGTMTMADDYLQFFCKHTDWAKGRLKDRDDFIKIGYNERGSDIDKGFLSRIVCVSFGPNNPGAARGKDSDLVIIEESGKCPNLSDVLDSTLPTLKDGSLVTGQMIVFGTGGGEGKLWEAFEGIMFAPSAEDFMSFNNIWDDDSQGTECGFFVPSYWNKRGFIDEDGNSDDQGAIEFEKGQREKRKKKGASKLNGYVMEEPFCPSEAFSRKADSILPVQQLAEQLRKVKSDDSIRATIRNGNIVRTADGVKFKDVGFANSVERKSIHDPIDEYPLKPSMDVYGCVTMFAPPYRQDTPNGRVVPPGLYRAWHDPYAVQKETQFIKATDSLGCTYIYERPNNYTPSRGDRLMAVLVGRRNTTNEYNDEMFDLMEYYNATLMFENDRGDVMTYARAKKLLHLLADEPDVMWKKELQTKKVGRNKGLTMNEVRKSNGILYLRDWLLEPRGIDEHGNKILNLHTIYDTGLLMEAIKWNNKGNFDRVSTMLVGMYDSKEQSLKSVPKPIKEVPFNNIYNRDLF